MMIEYPSIISSNAKQAPKNKPMIAFEKLDGSNIRVKYTPKRGFDLFGSRTQLIDESHSMLGGVVSVFNNTCRCPLEDYFKKFYSKEKEIIVYGEYVGPNSFAGGHSDPPELMKFVLFDILLIKNSYVEFVKPQDFVKIAEKLLHVVPTPRIIYSGNLTDEFVKNVRENVYNTNEGVVCKGTETSGAYRGKIWMTKIKTYAYLQRLKDRYKDDWEKYWE